MLAVLLLLLMLLLEIEVAIPLPLLKLAEWPASDGLSELGPLLLNLSGDKALGELDKCKLLIIKLLLFLLVE